MKKSHHCPKTAWAALKLAGFPSSQSGLQVGERGGFRFSPAAVVLTTVEHTHSFRELDNPSSPVPIDRSSRVHALRILIAQNSLIVSFPGSNCVL
jgi:hypothetical protein